MNSEDKPLPEKQDSLLLFQFSRPQNLVKFWKFTYSVKKILFLDTDPATLLIINETNEMQRLYCSIDKDQFIKQSKKKRDILNQTAKALEEKQDKREKVDYTFIDKKQDSKLKRKSVLEDRLQNAINDKET